MSCKRLFLIIVILCNFPFLLAQNNHQASMIISASKSEKTPLLLGLVGNNIQLTSCADILKIMLEQKHFKTMGFQVAQENFLSIPSKRTIKKYGSSHPIGIFLEYNKKNNALVWRLYDTFYASMIKGGQFNIQDMPVRVQAEHLADQLWPALTGQPGFFSTRIAFCKDIKSNNQRGIKQLCVIAPYAQTTKSDDNAFLNTLIERGKVFAPRWNQDTQNPLVLYSESTLSNVRLMSVDLKQKRKIISNFDGLNMLPSFSSDGKRVVYCLSINSKSQLYLYELNEDKETAHLKRLTHNAGNNLSPFLCANGDIIFCSDFEGKGPQICRYHHKDNVIEAITRNGYYACPVLNPKIEVIAYCKNVKGYMQIYLYDTKTKKHEQVTFDNTHKEECTWSPCGNLLAYSVDTGKTSRIALFNTNTREQQFITAAHERCTYPAWSPQYERPIVLASRD